MAQVKDVVLRFKQSPSADVVANRIRVRPANTPAAYDTPSEDIPRQAVNAEGFTEIPGGLITQFAGLEGRFDVHVTALDSRGNESDFLEIDNQLFDLSPPEAPTDGSVV